MVQASPLNWVEIVVHPRKFEVRPVCPEVWAGFEPLHVTVDWKGNKEEWLAVRVQGFADSSGRPLLTDPPHLEFYPSEGEVVKRLEFTSRIQADDYCKYEIEYQRKEPPETLVVDPTLRLKR
jgi:hypothetical protein